jgi:nucleotide-binding universal stress UspA family protein
MPLIESIFHPTDFSWTSDIAFAHALALALPLRAELTILHVDNDGDDDHGEWQHFPPVRRTLELWGLLEPDSSRSAVYEKLNLGVKKVSLEGRNATKTTLRYLHENPADLIVLGTEGRDGMPRWFEPSVAETMARRSKTMTLFVPRYSTGFVSIQHGDLSLQRILLPVDRTPSPEKAFAAATYLADVLGDAPTEITLLHVGEEAAPFAVAPPEHPACTWRTVQRRGEGAGGAPHRDDHGRA